MGTEQQFFTRRASGLIRTISATDALMFNLVMMAIIASMTFAPYSAAFYPGMDLVWGNTVALPLVLIIGLCWLYFALAMPRAGGDYVWVSRSIHPSIGLVDSLPLVIAIGGGWAGGIGRGFQDPSIASILAAFGMANAIPFWTSLYVSYSIAMISVAASLIIIAAGTKATFRFGWMCFIILLIGLFTYDGLMLSAGHAGFIARFETVSGTTPDAIIKAAQSAGYNTGFTMVGLWVGMVYLFLNYYGFAWSAYYSGEMKEFKRSNIYAILGAIGIFWVCTTSQYWVTYTVVGREFFHAMSYVSLNGNSAWTLPMWPNLAYLATFATDVPWLAAVCGVALWFQQFSAYVCYWVMTTRVIFAWSFDRVIPTAFSDIDQRFHAPRNALLLTGAIAFIFVTIGYVFPGLLAFLTYGTMGVYMSCAIVGLAALIFPFRRKDIFEKAPDFVKAKVAGIPVMAVLGLLTFIISGAVAVFSAMPAFSGAPVNPLYVSFMISIYIFAFIYYWVVAWYNKRRGLDMNVGYRELPPL